MRMPFLTGLVIAVATVTGGCASAGTGASDTAATMRPTSTGTSPAGPASTSPVPAPGGHVLTLTSAQDGKTYRVTVGTNVLVFLKSTPRDKWTLIRASGSVLRPSANGRMTLMLGVTGASFLAIRPGTSVITSTRPLCAASTTPAAASCDAIGMFRATVIVRAG